MYLFASTTLQFPIMCCFLVMGVGVGAYLYYVSGMGDGVFQYAAAKVKNAGASASIDYPNAAVSIGA
jgi:hypothetical protein